MPSIDHSCDVVTQVTLRWLDSLQQGLKMMSRMLMKLTVTNQGWGMQRLSQEGDVAEVAVVAAKQPRLGANSAA